MIFVGHDRSEDHHGIFVVDGQGGRLASARLVEGIEGVARFHASMADLGADPAEVAVGTETDRGLFVGAMVAAGYWVFAVNPKAVDRDRDRHRSSGAKSDAADARVLADLAFWRTRGSATGVRRPSRGGAEGSGLPAPTQNPCGTRVSGVRPPRRFCVARATGEQRFGPGPSLVERGRLDSTHQS